MDIRILRKSFFIYYKNNIKTSKHQKLRNTIENIKFKKNKKIPTLTLNVKDVTYFYTIFAKLEVNLYEPFVTK